MRPECGGGGVSDRSNAFAALLTGADGGDPGLTEDVERINYDDNINARLRINALGGKDKFTMDDNLSTTVLDGGSGDDTFQFGQVFRSERDARALGVLGELFPDRRIAAIDAFDLVLGQGGPHCVTQQQPAAR